MTASRDISQLSLIMRQEYWDIADFISHANSVKTSARTRYYKAAYYTSVQIVELLVYMIVIVSCENNPTLLGNFKKKFEIKLHELPAATLGSTKKLHIIESTQGPSTIEDICKDFQQMIAFCKSQGLIDANLKKRLDLIRVKRNDVHLQLRTSQSRHYTKAHINQLGDTTTKLIDLLLSL